MHFWMKKRQIAQCPSCTVSRACAQCAMAVSSPRLSKGSSPICGPLLRFFLPSTMLFPGIHLSCPKQWRKGQEKNTNMQDVHTTHLWRSAWRRRCIPAPGWCWWGTPGRTRTTSPVKGRHKHSQLHTVSRALLIIVNTSSSPVTPCKIQPGKFVRQRRRVCACGREGHFTHHVHH